MVRIDWPKGGHTKPLTGRNVERKVSVSIFRRAAKTIPFRVGLFALAIQLISGADDAHAAACPSGAKTRLEIFVSNVRAAKGDITIRSEEHTPELQSLMRISQAVSCSKPK